MPHLSLLKPDWTLSESSDGELDRLIEVALNRFLADWPWLSPKREDLRQEALIMIATRPSLRASIEQPALFVYELRMDLIDLHKSAAKTDHAMRITEADLLPVASSGIDRTGQPSRLPDRQSVAAHVRDEMTFSSATYSAAEVRALLPSVFDPAYGLGCTRGTSEGVVRSFRHPALVADVRSAWESTLLTSKQRQAILLVVVADHTQQQAGDLLGISRQAISDRVDAGIGRMLRHLNGVDVDELASEVQAA